MENFILDLNCGDTFDNASKVAKEIATGIADKTDFVRCITKSELPIVEFNFNGVKCLVNRTTDIDLLYRDYSNSHKIGWDIIGPNCLVTYDKKTNNKLERISKIKKDKYANENEKYRKKEAIEKLNFNTKINNIELQLIDVDGWNKTREANTDLYGNATMDYAEGWGKLMQLEMSNGFKLSDIAEKTSHELGFIGISGFMYCCAVNILSQCWKHGDELQEWYNSKC